METRVLTFDINPLKTCPEYTRAKVYGEYVL